MLNLTLLFIIASLSSVAFFIHHFHKKTKKTITAIVEPLYDETAFKNSFFYSDENLDSVSSFFFFRSLIVFLQESDDTKNNVAKSDFVVSVLPDRMLTVFYPYLFEAFYNLPPKQFKKFKPLLVELFHRPQLCAIAFKNNDTKFLNLCDVEKCLKLSPNLFV